MSALLQLQDLRFRWPGAASDTIAIDRFELLAGEAVFMHGPSGCGKSTLLSLVAGVLKPDGGQLCLLDSELSTMSSAQRDRFRADHVGYIFQQFNLLPYLSVRDNVLLACRFSKRRAERAAQDGSAAATAEQLLEAVGLGADFWHRRADRLSVGQQQRVAAARALIGRPELVIADEPTSALDEARRDNFMRLLLDACHLAGSALLFVSHDMRLAAQFDRTVELPSLNRAAAPEVVA
jgi:putative ABC transport system ATP-binding protein